VREPVDPGPETQPSLEARPGPHELLDSEPTSHKDSRPEDAPREDTRPPDTLPEDTRPPDTPTSEALPLPAQPVLVPAQYHYLKRPTFILVLTGVWIVAAVIGLGLFYYWFHALHKTPAVFSVLLFVVVCTVSAQLLAMVEHKPLVTAVAIALLSAPFAATAAAAAFYGACVFHWIPR